MKMYRASAVVEMAYLMPLVLGTWMVVILVLFHFHDKSILSGAAYEAAVVGTELWNIDAEEKETKVNIYFQERISGKMLLYSKAECEVKIDETKIEIIATATKKIMKIRVQQGAAITSPEKVIRQMQRWKEWSEEEIEW